VIRPGYIGPPPAEEYLAERNAIIEDYDAETAVLYNERFLSEAREAYDAHVAPGAGDDAKRRCGVASGSAHRTAQALFTMAHFELRQDSHS
jgi:hypothetical protein